MRRIAALSYVLMSVLLPLGRARCQFDSHFYKPLDIARAARQQWGPTATVKTVSNHLYGWRAYVGGRLRSLDLHRAVRDQYDKTYTLVSVGVHLYDWRAVRFSDLQNVVLPVMAIASDHFYNVTSVRNGLTRFRSVLVAVRNWYQLRANSTFCILQPLVVPTGKSSAAWNQLSADTSQSNKRYVLLDAGIAEYSASLPQPHSRLRVIVSPYCGNARDVWLGAGSRGRFALAPQRATSLVCPSSGTLDSRCADAAYAVGHELGHTFGLGHSCEVYRTDADCSRSIMQNGKPNAAILLDPEITKLVQTGFFVGSVVSFGTGCRGTNGTLVHTGSGIARIGNVQTFQLRNGPRSGFAMLDLGLSSRRWGSLRLPLGLGFLGAKGCSLYTDPLVTFVIRTTPTGSASLSLSHPNLRIFAGARFYKQFVALDPKANAWGATYSNGVATTLSF